MNFLRFHTSQGDGTFQLAPMIDIVFIVLVFYIVTSGLQQAEKEMVINPPTSEQGDSLMRRPYQIVINVDEDGQIIVNKETWQIDALANRLKDLQVAAGPEAARFSVIIRADGLTAHQNVINVMDACIAAGMSQMWFVTVDRER